ncbi:OmpA family protein [Spirulina sp. CCNP1310]|uniref:OmpA family protein n=1 Tax=Spirulina sp. CCNP1310 TaxID=3110249 RepID=UPI002B203A7C|nr:OmpA family protein [Spirulina sp. CCNP1310]MEA5419737.1 OmpA family protein [Spirulina sp. CCNP1310]
MPVSPDDSTAPALSQHSTISTVTESPHSNDFALGELFQFLTEKDVRPQGHPVAPAAARNGAKSALTTDEAGERLRQLLLDLLDIEAQQARANPDTPEEEQVWQLRLRQLEHQCRDPRVMGQVIFPVFAVLLQKKIAQSPEEIIPALALIIDRVIETRSQGDRTALSKVLATAIPGAISKQLGEAPNEVIQAIAPAMGKAITEQVRLDRDAMVDALYPVIGNTISKYMGEVVSQINTRVEQTLSIQGIMRRFSLRWQGISDAEQILRDALPFRVQAVFLIHKNSGLVIAEVQQSGSQALETDMLAGMLTAIRSFAGECSTDPRHQSELTKIDYEDFQIIMEVAGYCYIAAVTQGDPPTNFSIKLRQTLSAIILNHGYGGLLEQFDGDARTVPDSIPQLLTELLIAPTVLDKPKVRRRPLPVGLLILLILLGIPLGWVYYRHWQKQQVILAVDEAIAATPNLALYAIRPQIEGGTLILNGKVPSPDLREEAGIVALDVAPDLVLDNQLLTVVAPPNPEAIAAEAQRLTQSFGQMLGAMLTSRYDRVNQQLMVEGGAIAPERITTLTESLRQIPGVQSVVLTFSGDPSPTAQRLYFNTNGTIISPQEQTQKLEPLVAHLQANPNIRLQIIGHTDTSGTEKINRQLAPERAQVVKDALVQLGIDGDRLVTAGTIAPPPQVTESDALWLSRCVRFEVLN